MLPYWYDEQISKDNKEKFVQEHLYVDVIAPDMYSEDISSEKKDEVERGIIIFEL